MSASSRPVRRLFRRLVEALLPVPGPWKSFISNGYECFDFKISPRKRLSRFVKFFTPLVAIPALRSPKSKLNCYLSNHPTLTMKIGTPMIFSVFRVKNDYSSPDGNSHTVSYRCRERRCAQSVTELYHSEGFQAADSFWQQISLRSSTCNLMDW